MKNKQNLQTLYPFLHAKPTKARRDEDAFMQEHGGRAARGMFIMIEAIAAICSAFFAKPIDWFLTAIHYESPMSSTPPADASVGEQSGKPIPPRQRGTASKKCAHASPVTDTKSQARRRA